LNIKHHKKQCVAQATSKPYANQRPINRNRPSTGENFHQSTPQKRQITFSEPRIVFFEYQMSRQLHGAGNRNGSQKD